MSRSIQPGSLIGRYRVVSQLGAGGMGEVYLARDESLDRSIALKILPPELVKHEERVRRFQQEARSASSLSHPNIITIHEIGEAEVQPGDAGAPVEPDSAPRVHFIAMELVSGHTLATLIHKEQTDLRTLVRYLAQAAEGVAKAHAAGLVHRDLKPENVMVTADGFAKVLDFGLAKLTEPALAGGTEGGAVTASVRKTDAGVILGTVGYMSPEQVQGRSVDHRSDIFSFGCLLYEAATRQRPFAADSDLETLHRILKDKPAPIEDVNPEVPGELRRIIRRALVKNADQRLQSMKDLAIALAEIADEYDTLSLSSGSGSTTTVSGTGLAAAGRSGTRALTLAALAVGVVGVAAAGWAWFGGRGTSAPDSSPFAAMEMTKVLTLSGLGGAALSPDGRYLAYGVRTAGQSSLRMRQLATGTDVELLAPGPSDVGDPLFSPDGNHVYYFNYDQSRDVPSFWQIAALGGTPRVALDNVWEAAIAPDGRQIAGIRSDQQAREVSVVLVATDGSAERTLVSRTGAGGFYAPAWSPDGRRLALSEYVVQESGAGGERLVEYVVADGTSRVLTAPQWSIYNMAWLPDATGLVMLATDRERGVQQIWLVSVADGSSRRITNDSNDYRGVSLSADGSTLATAVSRRTSRLWVAPGQAPEAGRALAEEDLWGFTAARDRILFVQERAGRSAIWTMAPDGTGRRPLSPDRFRLRRDPESRGRRRVEIVTADGATVVRSLELPADGCCERWTRTGDALLFLRETGGVENIWSMPIAGGEPRQITRFEADTIRDFTFSADGAHLILARSSPAPSDVMLIRNFR